jgi:hypothetical protein
MLQWVQNHLALQYNASSDVIAMQLKAYPMAVKIIKIKAFLSILHQSVKPLLVSIICYSRTTRSCLGSK